MVKRLILLLCFFLLNLYFFINYYLCVCVCVCVCVCEEGGRKCKLDLIFTSL